MQNTGSSSRSYTPPIRLSQDHSLKQMTELRPNAEAAQPGTIADFADKIARLTQRNGEIRDKQKNIYDRYSRAIRKVLLDDEKEYSQSFIDKQRAKCTDVLAESYARINPKSQHLSSEIVRAISDADDESLEGLTKEELTEKLGHSIGTAIGENVVATFKNDSQRIYEKYVAIMKTIAADDIKKYAVEDVNSARRSITKVFEESAREASQELTK